MYLNLVIIFSVGLQCLALFEDQVGKFDWLVQNIGEIKWSRFVSISSQSYLLVASSEALALVNAADGVVAWRKVFGDTEGLLSSVSIFDGSSHVATFHERRHLYRVFDYNSGNLKYELSLLPETGLPEVVTDYTVASKQPSNVFMVSKTSLQSIATDDSDNWNFPLSVNSDDFITRKLLVNEKDKTLVATTLYKSAVHSLKFDVSSGDKIEEIRRYFEFSYKNCHLEGKFIVCWAEDTLSHFSLDSLPNSERVELISSNLGHKIETVQLIDSSVFLVTFKNSEEASLVDIANDKIEVIKHFSGFLASSQLSTSYLKAEPSFAFLHSEDGSLTVTAIKVESKETLFSHQLKVKIHEKHGKPIHVAVTAGRSSDKPDKVFIVAEDMKTLMIGISGKSAEHKVLWSKDESLSQVINVQMCDLNLSEAMITLEADFEFATRAKTTLFEMFYRRFSSHVSQLVSFAQSTYDKIANQKLFMECSADSDELVRDQFNVNKMIIVLTKNGKVLGMLSTSGKIIWSFRLSNMEFVTSYGGDPGSFLFVQRGTEDYKFDPRAVVVGRSKTTRNVALVYFNPLSGEILESVDDAGFKALQVFTLPSLITEDNLKSFAFLLEDKTLKIYPESKDNRLQFEQLCSKANFVALVPMNDKLLGIKYSSAEKSQTLWSHSIGVDHTVYGIFSKREGELVDSPGKVQSDQTVLFKYLNPNLIVLVLSPKQQDASESRSESDAKYLHEFSLLDSISGETVFSTTMKRISDIKVVHSENWVVMSVWNEKNRRTELTVIELYESGKDADRNATHFSSFANSSAPLVLRQSYIYPSFIKSLATTYSEKGLTNKQVIVGTSTGALVPIPKHILDPRRTLTSRAAAREEGLIPYHPVISLPLEMTINYNRSIASIRGSFAYPGGLESTVLLFTYGLDVFFTQVFPSEMFDVLSADFEFWIIGGVCSALFIASFVTKKLSAYYALKKAWK